MGTGLHLALGLGLVGAAGYGFIAIVGQIFVIPEYAAELSALTSLYLLINIIGPGLFAALEPEMSRAVSAGIARQEPIRPVARQMAVRAAAIFGCLVVVLVALWPLVLSRVFAGRWTLLGALLLGAAGAAAVYWVRGILSGQQHFGGYGTTLYAEGLARLVPCVVLLLVLVRDPGAYGFAFAAGTIVAAAVVLPTVRLGPAHRAPGRPAAIGSGLAFLVTATLLTQAVANLAPVIVTYRMSDDLVTASAFGVSFVLARIPLMLFAPIQAVLLPHLTRAAEAGRTDVVQQRMRQVLLAVAGVGLPCVLAGVVFGPWAVRALFTVSDPPSPLVFGLLGLSAVLIMTALVLQPALIALRCQRTVMTAWGAGTVVFLAALVAPVDPVAAALVGQLAGPLVVLAVAGSRLRALLRPAAQLSAPGRGVPRT